MESASVKVSPSPIMLEGYKKRASSNWLFGDEITNAFTQALRRAMRPTIIHSLSEPHHKHNLSANP